MSVLGNEPNVNIHGVFQNGLKIFYSKKWFERRNKSRETEYHAILTDCFFTELKNQFLLLL